MNPLEELRGAGQSVWLDFMRRSMITGDAFERLIAEDGLAGATSNPTIFGKAIGGSSDYDAQIGELVSDGVTDPREIFYALALVDIQGAADLFRPVYEEAGGADGFVSFELEANLAHDAAGSIEAAKDLSARFDRPNVMIKVPGTVEGPEAVEELTVAGVSVNITLLFSIEAYEAVAHAYVAGLERRLEAGEPLDAVASVASFFVSRVDAKVDDRLPEGSPLRGKAAIANAKLAYRRFGEIFSGERWERLARAGARVQRPLWASTSVKNPDYPDVMYVEELVGDQTVNTMPQSTVDAFRDHGKVDPGAVGRGYSEAEKTLGGIAEAGIDLDDVTAELAEEGIASFDKDFQGLLETIEGKVAELGRGERRWRASLGPVEKAVGDRMRALEEDDVIRRIWRKDHTVWKDDPTEITDRLGWLTAHERMRDRIPGLETFAKEAAADGLRTAVLLGMGGSSLAPEVLRETFGVADGALDLVVLDTTHPGTIARIEEGLDLDATLFLAASKSGTTLETRSHLEHFWERTGGAGDRFVAITDHGTPLEKLAAERGFRAVFRNSADIGGRYSALSLFGLVPGAITGAPLAALLDAAEEMACACDACVEDAENAGAFLGAVLGEAARAGRDKLTLLLPGPVASLGAWIEQLIAESTGKEGTGILPIDGEPLADPDVYGEDRLFVALGEHVGLDAVEEAGHPVVRLADHGAEALGAELFRWEFATAVAGHVLGIHPFDQPNVQEAKDVTSEILEAGTAPQPDPGDTQEILGTVRPGNYIAIQAFVDATDEIRETLERVRLALRERHRVAVTVGIGPRFLHSTGQVHKGGPETGVFLQVTDPGRETDLEIPGKPYTFGTLLDAQADGDLRALRNRGRRAARVTLDRLEALA